MSKNNRDKNPTEQGGEYKVGPGHPPLETRFGGPRANPRHNGSWHKEDTPRYKMEQIMKMSDEELEKIRENKKKTTFERSFANVLYLSRTATDVEEASKALKMLNDMVHEVYGKMPEMQVTVEADEETKEEASKIIRGFALP